MGRLKWALQMDGAGADTFHYSSLGSKAPGILPISGSSKDHSITLPHCSYCAESQAQDENTSLVVYSFLEHQVN